MENGQIPEYPAGQAPGDGHGAQDGGRDGQAAGRPQDDKGAGTMRDSGPVCRENARDVPSSPPQNGKEENAAPDGAPDGHAPDIFDRIFAWRLLWPFSPFFARHREGLLYLFFGALTTAVSWGSFYLFCYPWALGELVAEALSWTAAVLFAFVTNRTFVFRAGDRPLWRALGLFVAARLLTLAFGEGVLFLFTTLMGYEPMAVKILSELTILALNYLFSKVLVFRRK